ncbi:MAG: glycosyltransferase family 2 protein [Rickettsiales bacterium]|nr:glycosyltransferase family 2 protein [Rickettsiales bacterium]
MPRSLISVVVPIYNEEANIHNFYERLTAAVDGQPYDVEMILVNDGSRDRSFELLRALAEKDPRVTAVNLSRNFGSYAAINCGWEIARGDAIMCISADLQDPPEIIREFFPAWQQGHHVVWGVRAGRKDPFVKSLLARFFYFVLRKVALPDFPKDGMDIGLFDRQVVNEYLKLKEKHGVPFVTIFTMGFRQARIPYVRMERTAGESGWPFWKRVKFALDVIVDHSYTPIRLMTMTGCIIAGFAFAYALLLVFLRVFFDHGGDGWTSLATLIVFLGGIQMMFLGVIAEYLWRTSSHVNHRPAYYVMDIVCSEKNPNRNSQPS